MPVVVVTGTGTGVGKTVVTAALAALAQAAGRSVSVVKPVQTGLRSQEPGDLDVVHRLSGIVDLHEWARYPDALAPATAARRAGLPAPTRNDIVARVAALGADLVLVEGAGGLLVHYDDHGTTVADLAGDLRAAALVVVRAGLGTLNDTALTLEALARRGVPVAGLVLGSWPDRPDLADRCNVADLESLTGDPLAGALAAGAGDLGRDRFVAVARAGLGPALGGEFDAADFRRRWEAW